MVEAFGMNVEVHGGGVGSTCSARWSAWGCTTSAARSTRLWTTTPRRPDLTSRSTRLTTRGTSTSRRSRGWASTSTGTTSTRTWCSNPPLRARSILAPAAWPTPSAAAPPPAFMWKWGRVMSVTCHPLPLMLSWRRRAAGQCCRGGRDGGRSVREDRAVGGGASARARANAVTRARERQRRSGLNAPKLA